jgi:hypothetical protein
MSILIKFQGGAMVITRYAVRMKNGDYMLQDFDDEVAQRVLIHSVGNPIDSSLLKTRETAQRCINEILSGNTNLLVLYDDDNPPEEVVELKIEYQLK